MTRALALAVLLCPAIAAAAAPDSCEITASGGLSFTAQGSGKPSSVGTDYWLTEDELREALNAVAGIEHQLSDEERKKKVAAQMKEDPRLMLLLLNCDTDAATLTFGPSSGSKYKDVPMVPRRYKLGAGMNARPGEMTVLLNIKKERRFWRMQPGGTLDITAWDKKHIAGTFDFSATAGLGKDESGGAPARITGSFDFPCRGPKGCAK